MEEEVSAGHAWVGGDIFAVWVLSRQNEHHQNKRLASLRPLMWLGPSFLHVDDDEDLAERQSVGSVTPGG